MRRGRRGRERYRYHTPEEGGKKITGAPGMHGPDRRLSFRRPAGGEEEEEEEFIRIQRIL